MIVTPFSHRIKEQINSGENVTGTTKEKNFGYSHLACWPVYSAYYSNWHFPFSVHMLENLRLKPFTLQLNQAVFYPSSHSDHYRINMSVKTYSFGDVIPRHPENQASTYYGT
jgi:hypothetical protein